MSNDSRWRREGNAFEQPDGDATRPIPADSAAAQGASRYDAARGAGGYGAASQSGGASAPGASGSHAATGGEGASGYPSSGAAPTYAPSYGGGSGGGGDYPPGDDRPQRGGGFPWLAVILGVLAVAVAAAAVWFFLLRDGDENGGEEPTPDDSGIEAPSGEAGSDGTDGEEESSDDEAPSDDEDETEDETDENSETESGPDSESPSDDADTDEDDESPSDDGSGGADDATVLEIGETHTFDNGMEITLDEAERDAQCLTSPGTPHTALTFTVSAGEDEVVPTVPPLPGITLSTSEGDLSPTDGMGCSTGDSMPPVVDGGEEVTATIYVPEPSDDSFDVLFRPAAGIVTGESESLAWTID
ncbi:hypothetical protein ACPYO6_01980 [Georgenia sp. Z1344]|uniref:hypothetical protein n=1 Tax=Georgenia sp. Z1344 TaxID=3416706 RepID=UPI003CED9FA7